MHVASRPNHVVIADGGVAAVECALALHDLAGDRVRLTMIAPEPRFELRPMRTGEPFSRSRVQLHALEDLSAHVGAKLITNTVARVDADRHTLLRAGDRTVAYDALVLRVAPFVALPPKIVRQRIDPEKTKSLDSRLFA